MAARVTILEKVGYGLGDAACNVVLQLVMTFLAYFYTDVFGIEAAAMGVLFLAVRAITAWVDPIFGVLCDRTQTRWGKFRPYLIWFSLPFALATVAAFSAPDLSPTMKLVYAFVTQSVLMICYSAVNVPYSALGAVVTSEPKERVSLNGYRFFFATAGGAVVASAAMPLVSYLGDGDERLGFTLATAVLALLAAVMLWACFATTHERVVQATPERSTLWKDLGLLVRNDQWRVVAAMNFILFIAIIIQDGAAIYYVTWCLDSPQLVGAFVTTGLVASMLGAASAGPLVGGLPRAKAYCLLQVVVVVLSVWLFLVPHGSVTTVFVVYALQQYFTQMASPVLWSMMADAVDYGESTTGRRITGLAMSGALLALKLGAAIGGALLGWLLAFYGYQSQALTQSPEAVAGIHYLFTMLPATGHLALALLTWLVHGASKRETPSSGSDV